MNDYDENMDKLIAMDRKYGIKYFLLYGLGWSAVGNITFFALILYMITRLGNGSILVGGFGGKRERHLENPLDAD